MKTGFENRSDTATATMSYKVYLAMYHGIPNHHAIFVETQEDGPSSGFLYQVTGSTQQGMVYEFRKSKPVADDPAFAGKDYLGEIKESDYSQMLDICKKIPPPEQQFEGPRKLDPKAPLRHCHWWCDETVTALKSENVLKA